MIRRGRGIVWMEDDEQLFYLLKLKFNKMNDSGRSCLNDPELGWTFVNLGEHEHELERSWRFWMFIEFYITTGVLRFRLR